MRTDLRSGQLGQLVHRKRSHAFPHLLPSSEGQESMIRSHRRKAATWCEVNDGEMVGFGPFFLWKGGWFGPPIMSEKKRTPRIAFRILELSYTQCYAPWRRLWLRHLNTFKPSDWVCDCLWLCRTPPMPLRQWRAGEKLRRQHPHSSCQFVICACALGHWVKPWAPMDQGTKGVGYFGIVVNHLLFEADMISMLQFFQVC